MANLLKTRCTFCQEPVRIDEGQIGKQVRCPSCRRAFEVGSISIALAETLNPASLPLAEETLLKRLSDTGPLVGLAVPIESAPPAATKLGRLGRFELLEVLGQGGFGRVYRARDPQLDREVALKVPTFGADDDHKIQRFVAEAKAAARLRHPHIVPTFESGQTEGRYFIASQFVPGKPLSQHLKAGPPTIEQAARWVHDLADALAYAHSEGIVHRDIKPGNIMIDAKGGPQIMDFGLAKRVNEDSAMTTDGSILGTPAYMSPEQARGESLRVGPASDQYSLGVILYELLTGQKPFDGQPHAVIAQVISTEPPSPRSLRPEIPRDLEAICQKAMHKEIERRFSTTADLAADLARWLRGDATLARPISLPERATRWAGRNPAVASLLSVVVMVTALGVAGISLALVKAHFAQAKAVASAKLAEDEQKAAAGNLRIADEQRKLAQANLIEADLQRAAAETAQKLAERREAEAKLATEEAEAKAKELATALAQLKTESVARLAAESSQKLAEEDKANLQTAAKTLSAERDQALLASEDALYRDLLGKAVAGSGALPDEEVLDLLARCPESRRGWEWKYLQAQIAGRDRVLWSTQIEARPTRLIFSRDGAKVLGGTSFHKEKLAWNGIWDFSTGKLAELPLDLGEGGRVCNFSRDGQSVYTVNNTQNRHRARPQHWTLDEGVWRAQNLKLIEGFAFDCGTQKDSDFLLLYAPARIEGGGRFAVFLPVISQHLNTDVRFHLPGKTGEIVDARYDSLLERVHLLTTDAMAAQWQTFRFKGAEVEQRVTLPPFGFAVTHVHNGYDVRVFSQFVAPSHLVLTGDYQELQRGRVIIHDGKPLDRLFAFPDDRKPPAGVAAPRDAVNWLPAGVPAFTPDGKRILIISAARGIKVFDPTSPAAATPLLHVQLPGEEEAGSLYQVTLAFDQTGDRMALAINNSITFINVALPK